MFNESIAVHYVMWLLNYSLLFGRVCTIHCFQDKDALRRDFGNSKRYENG